MAEVEAAQTLRTEIQIANRPAIEADIKSVAAFQRADSLHRRHGFNTSEKGPADELFRRARDGALGALHISSDPLKREIGGVHDVDARREWQRIFGQEFPARANALTQPERDQATVVAEKFVDNDSLVSVAQIARLRSLQGAELGTAMDQIIANAASPLSQALTADVGFAELWRLAGSDGAMRALVAGDWLIQVQYTAVMRIVRERAQNVTPGPGRDAIGLEVSGKRYWMNATSGEFYEVTAGNATGIDLASTPTEVADIRLATTPEIVSGRVIAQAGVDVAQLLTALQARGTNENEAGIRRAIIGYCGGLNADGQRAFATHMTLLALQAPTVADGYSAQAKYLEQQGLFGIRSVEDAFRRLNINAQDFVRSAQSRGIMAQGADIAELQALLFARLVAPARQGLPVEDLLHQDIFPRLEQWYTEGGVDGRYSNQVYAEGILDRLESQILPFQHEINLAISRAVISESDRIRLQSAVASHLRDTFGLVVTDATVVAVIAQMVDSSRSVQFIEALKQEVSRTNQIKPLGERIAARVNEYLPPATTIQEVLSRYGFNTASQVGILSQVGITVANIGNELNITGTISPFQLDRLRQDIMNAVARAGSASQDRVTAVVTILREEREKVREVRRVNTMYGAAFAEGQNEKRDFSRAYGKDSHIGANVTDIDFALDRLDLYAFLGIRNPSAISADQLVNQVTQAVRKLQRLLHADNAGDARSNALFALVTTIGDRLKDQTQRENYQRYGYMAMLHAHGEGDMRKEFIAYYLCYKLPIARMNEIWKGRSGNPEDIRFAIYQTLLKETSSSLLSALTAKLYDRAFIARESGPNYAAVVTAIEQNVEIISFLGLGPQIANRLLTNALQRIVGRNPALVQVIDGVMANPNYTNRQKGWVIQQILAGGIDISSPTGRNRLIDSMGVNNFTVSADADWTILDQSGAEGVIYKNTAGTRVIKTYKWGVSGLTRLQRNIGHMLQHPPRRYPHLFAWPTGVYVQRNAIEGYEMPAIDPHAKRDLLRLEEPGGNATLKLGAAVDLARIVTALHDAGYVCIDFNPQNFLLDRDKRLIMIDTDSLGENGLFMPGYLPYEDLEGKRYLYGNPINNERTSSKESDAWALAVHAFTLLVGSHPFDYPATLGAHPYNDNWYGYNVVRNNYLYGANGGALFAGIAADFGDRQLYQGRMDKFHALPPYLQNMFQQFFVQGRIAPKNRPTAQELLTALERYQAENL